MRKWRYHAPVIFRWLTERRRERLRAHPFPADWDEILERNVTAVRFLTEPERARLRELVVVFLDEKHWEGCGGLELTDEIRVTVAGTACLLLLGRDHELMRDVESILVYPSSVLLPDGGQGTLDGRPRVTQDSTPVLGAAHRGGPVVLAWDAVLHGSRNARDGRNLVIHEMAHKIDFLDGQADGTPPLESRAELQRWVKACTEAFQGVRAGTDPVLREYAGTNEAEFFAVASEVFFERPRQLAHEHPELYRVLAEVYNLDLAARSAPSQ